jgi:tRNA pseudouridine55 synthase
MRKILNNPEQFFKIIMAILTIYVGIFVYLELTTVRKETAIEADEFSVSLEDVPEEVELTLQSDPAFQTGGEVRNVVRDASDSRQRSQDDWSQDAASSTRSGNPEQSARDFERSLYDEFGGAKERERIQAQSAERMKNNTNGASGKLNPTTNQGGNQNQYAGSVMVDFSLPGRTAFENKKWHVRNPGYTCGYNSSGLVVVNISVNNSGRVVAKAIDQSRSSSTTPCMIEQALKYASLSRFNSGSGTVNGYISYRFVSQ